VTSDQHRITESGNADGKLGARSKERRGSAFIKLRRGRWVTASSCATRQTEWRAKIS